MSFDGGKPRHGNALSFRSVVVAGQSIRVATRAGIPGADSRPPMLICNGIGANIELLVPLIEALPNRPLILFDAPGAGASPAPIFPYRLRSLAGTIMKLLDELEYAGLVDVMGISWGGVLAQAVAFHQGSRVRKLLLAATSPGFLMIPGRADVLMKLASPRRYTDPNFIRENGGAIYGGRFGSRGDVADKHGATIIAPSTRGYLYQMLATWGWTSLPWLWLIRHPTLILHGTDDPIVPLVNAKIMSSLIPNARLREFDDGHLFMITNATEIGEIIDEFLDQ